MKSPDWARVAAEVLNEPSVDCAREVLAEALRVEFGSAQVARVRVAPSGLVEWFISGNPLPDAALPTADAVDRHPLNRYRLASPDPGPVLLTEALRTGWAFEADTRNLMEELSLSLHQLSIPVDTGPRYAGWVLVADGGFARGAVARSRRVQPLLRGLDRHLALLAASTGNPEVVGLTPREVVVLGLLAGGRTAGAIAVRLGISARTVHKHQEHLYRKLGAVDRLSAVLRAQEAGVLPPAAPGPVLGGIYSPPGEQVMR